MNIIYYILEYFLTLIEIKFKSLSPTIALANNVFPVPGAPNNKIPDCSFRGHLLKISLY